jgi:hypothetical protein
MNIENMASSDEYQQIQFWEKLKELPFGPICVESNEKAECLVSAQFVIIDISKPKKPNDTRSI